METRIDPRYVKGINSPVMYSRQFFEEVATSQMTIITPKFPKNVRKYNLVVTQPGDLNVDGGYATPDATCSPIISPPACGWGSSFATGIRIGLPRARVCLSDAFLDSGPVTLDGASCFVDNAELISGGMPCAVGPTFGSLAFSGSVNNAQVTYRISETDAESGKVNRRGRARLFFCLPTARCGRTGRRASEVSRDEPCVTRCLPRLVSPPFGALRLVRSTRARRTGVGLPDALREAAFEALTEEVMLVVVLQVYHAE